MYSSLTTLVSIWCHVDTPAAEPFVCRTLPWLCVQTLLLPELKLGQKSAAGIVAAVASLHIFVASQYKAAFDPVMHALLEALGTPVDSETGVQAIAMVHSGDVKSYSTLLTQIAEQSKSK